MYSWILYSDVTSLPATSTCAVAIDGAEGSVQKGQVDKVRLAFSHLWHTGAIACKGCAGLAILWREHEQAVLDASPKRDGQQGCDQEY